MTAIVVADKSGTIVYVNEDLLGLIDPNQYKLIGFKLTDLLDREGNSLQHYLSAPATGKKPHFHEVQFAGPKGGVSLLRFKVYPVLDAAQEKLEFHVAASTAFRTVPADSPEIKPDALRSVYPHTSLSYDEGLELFNRVNEKLQAEQLFRDPDVDLRNLSHDLNTNQLYLSQAINFFSGMPFRDYLNKCRIEWLSNDCTDCHSMPVADLWSHAGFGSYSAFRRYIIANLEMSPSQFARGLRQARKQQQQQEVSSK